MGSGHHAVQIPVRVYLPFVVFVSTAQLLNDRSVCFYPWVSNNEGMSNDLVEIMVYALLAIVTG